MKYDFFLLNKIYKNYTLNSFKIKITYDFSKNFQPEQVN